MGSIKEIENEKENTVETIVKISETESDRPTQPHNGKSIDQIVVSQYNDDSYVVTYNKEDKSVLGWNIEDIEENGRQRPHVYFKLVHVYYRIVDFVLNKKILAFCDDCGGKY